MGPVGALWCLGSIKVEGLRYEEHGIGQGLFRVRVKLTLRV